MTSDLAQLGRLLVERGLTTDAAVKRTLARRELAGSEALFLTALLRDERVPEGALVCVLADRQGTPAVDLSRSAFALDVLDLVPRAVAEADQMLPLATDGGRLHVAVADPTGSADVSDEIRFITGLEVSLYAAVAGPLQDTILAAYDARERGESTWRGSALPATAAIALTLFRPGDPVPRPGVTTGKIFPRITDPIAIEIGDGDSEEEVVLDAVKAGPRRILVVDDDPDIVKLCVVALRKDGYVVESAGDGREAEERLRKDAGFDLVLLDAMLPGLHGFELCSRIKGDAALRHVQVLMMSAVHRGWRFAQDARESFGADDYLEKPFHVSELQRRVTERLQQQAQPEAHRKEADRLYRKGLELLELSRIPEARDALEQAAKADPFSARSHFALARTLAQSGDVFRAMSEYERAIELRPNLFPALRNLAQLYLQKGFRSKATETLERALQHAPDPATREQLRAQLLKLL